MAQEAVEETSWAQDGDEYQVDGESGVIQNSDNAQQDINTSSSVALQTSGDLASHADGASEDVGDYDPESVDLAPLPQQEQEQVPSPQSSPRPSPQPAAQPAPVPKKPKTAGGFLVEDSDSEDDTPAPASNGLPTHPAQASQSLSQSPLHTSVPAPRAQEAVSNVPSASQANNAPLVSLETSANLRGGPAPQTGAASYLPQDVVTRLEERIKQDPRAAMDAWLDLIAELRRRNDIDALRGVYERFLAVFPQSVSLTGPRLDIYEC